MEKFRFISQIVLCWTLAGFVVSASSEHQDSFLAESSAFIPTVFATNISQRCIDDSRFYVEALNQHKDWALTMYDSTGKLLDRDYSFNRTNDGYDTLYVNGMYDKCLSVSSERFIGQYCSVFLHTDPVSPSTAGPKDASIGIIENRRILSSRVEAMVIPARNYLELPSTRNLVVGFCLPSTCSATDLHSAVAQKVGRNTMEVPNSLSVATIADETYCFTREKVATDSALDWPSTVYLTFVGVWTCLVVCATVCEAFWIWMDWKPVETMPVRLLQCFSLVRNGKQLISTEPSASAGEFSSLHGIRVLSTIWLVFTHFTQDTSAQFTNNRRAMLQVATLWPLQFLTNGSIAVDTFFVMGSFLAARAWLQDLDRGRSRYGIRFFYLFRYLRFTPVYAIVLGFAATLWPRIGSGPYWSQIQQMSQSCRSLWWTHVLYINNRNQFVPTHTCLIETWYLASEMQMFLLSPLVIYPLWRWRRAGLVWTLSVLMAFFGANVLAHIAWDLPPTLMPHRTSLLVEIFDYMTKYYTTTFSRIPEYIVGILLAYIFHQTSKSQNGVNLKKSMVLLGWATAIFIGLLVQYGLVPYVDEKTVPVIDKWVSVSYGSFHRSAWAIAVSWVIFACAHGYGGIVNRFLSLKIFAVLGRLTFAIFLTHYSIVIKTFNLFYRQPVYFTLGHHFVSFLGILTTCLTLAAFIVLLLEMPLAKVIGVLFGPKKNKTKEAEKCD